MTATNASKGAKVPIFYAERVIHMTEQQARSKAVSTALGYLGAVQGDARHAEILGIYNNFRPLPQGYAVKANDAWCSTFVSVVGMLLGWTDIMPPECSCGRMIELYRKHPQSKWEENDAYVPQPGDLIMYSWKDIATGFENQDNTLWPDHVGIIEKVEGRVITVIEGNYSKSVKRRNIAVNGRYIRGYCLPAYRLKASEAPAIPVAPDATPNDEIIWQYFKSKNTFTDEGIAGLMGNLYAESGLNPNNLENWMNEHLDISDEEFTRRVDDGTYNRDWFINKNGESGRGKDGGWGYGLNQATWWSRKQKLYDKAKAKGVSIGDLQMQLDYVWEELQGYPNVMATLKSARSVLAASNVVLAEYEKPADMSTSVQLKRAEYGQKYYDKFAAKEQKEDFEMLTPDEFYEKYFAPAMQRWNKETAALDPADWSEDAREWAEGNGLIKGVGEDADGEPIYQYKTYLTREMAATLFHRFYECIVAPAQER